MPGIDPDIDIDPCAPGCLRGHGAACHALASGHRRYCTLIAAGRLDYASLVDRLTADPGHGRTAGRAAPPPDDPTLDALIEAVRACPAWAPGDCSCGLDRCAFGRGRGAEPGRVSLADCRGCLRSRGLIH